MTTVKQAKERADEAAEAVEAAIVRAHQDRLPIAQIAREAGLSRQTVYDILARRGAR